MTELLFPGTEIRMGKCGVFSGLAALAAFLAAIPAYAATSSGACEKPWIFFDLGNTVVKTTIDPGTRDIAQVSYMPEIQDYLKSLKQKGYHLGLIVNVPQEWGKTRPEKIVTLKNVIREKWVGTPAMDWAVFDLGILVPPSDRERKPEPFLFEEAYRMARARGCEAVYQGETPREVAAASMVGLHGFEIGRPGRFFLPEAEITAFTKD